MGSEKAREFGLIDMRLWRRERRRARKLVSFLRRRIEWAQKKKV